MLSTSRAATGPSANSSSAPSSSLVMRWKKRVGGIWRSSPTTTIWRQRAMAPSASTGSICDASSITSRSKVRPGLRWDAGRSVGVVRPPPAGGGDRNCATESGDIMKTGFAAWIARPARSSSTRTGRWPRFFSNSPFRISWPGMPARTRASASAWVKAQRRRVSLIRSRSASAKSATSRSKAAPSKVASSGRARIAAFSSASSSA